MAALTRQVEAARGAERAWAFRNRAMLLAGNYTSDELIDMAMSVGFTLADPLMRVRRGTVIRRGASLLDGTSIEGAGVEVGEGAVLSRAAITGSGVRIGPGTLVTGAFAVDRVETGADNRIEDLKGENTGTLRIGDRNHIQGVTVANPSGNGVTIGDDNTLYPGLAVNAPFAGFGVTIGHRNQLGRDGGGVISGSYRFNRKWGGPVVIGSGVETTRGAEILGYSLLGVSPAALRQACGMDEDEIAAAFVDGPLAGLDALLDRVAASLPGAEAGAGTVSLFGTVKVKRSCVCPGLTVKDDTRLFCAFARDANIPERCKVFYSSIRPPAGAAMSISAQDIAIVRADLRGPRDWGAFPTTADVDDYPTSDESYRAARGHAGPPSP